ncbi:MAG: hypothetical protein S4CHLAM2_17800 [Chlamydiales bacterium]|nr:hypothetical protein [Chlamydiales bacterium]
MRIATLLFVISLIWNGQAYSQDVEPMEHGHVHEAFMNVEETVTLLVAIPEQPPAPLKEEIPPQKDPKSVWVPGYWNWSALHNDFVWCSGSWRRPPPNHQWITGSWQKLDEGWVRLRGFWSTVPEDKLTYISQTPPDPYDEHPTNRPDKDYFWMSGYWKFDKDYKWFSGKWEQLDENWIYVPPKYVWRPSGYVFVPAFWDWPLDQRGTAYACLLIPEGQTEIQYLPEYIMEPSVLLDACLLYYPDYCYFYYYYHHFHIDWWFGCDWCPPWWGWDSWWWLPWWDQWGLWWWWSHPGFPIPFWLDQALLDLIFGPPQALINVMKNLPPPLIIGPNGAIPPGDLIDTTEDDKPVFPEDPRDNQEEAGRDEEGSIDRPRGPETPREDLGENAPNAPQTTPRPPVGAKPGEQPSVPSTPGTVETPPKPEVEPDTRPPSYTPPSRPPSYTPPSRPVQPPSYRPPQRPVQPPSSYPPQRPSQPPSYRPPSRPIQPPSFRPPQRPSQPPSYYPQPSRPSSPPSSSEIPQTRPPSFYPQPSRPSKPPSSSEIPQTRPPSYMPSAPSRQIRPSYRPQTPSLQNMPSTPQLQRPQSRSEMY